MYIIFLLIALVASLQAGTIPLDSPTGDLGTSYSWGTVTAYGFNQEGQPADLVGVDQPYNYLPGDGNNDQGLGLDNSPVCGGAPLTTISTLPGYIRQSIAFDIQGGEAIWFTGIDAVEIAAYYPALADDAAVWGAQWLSGPKTWLFALTDEDLYSVPSGYAYIVVTGSNILVGEVETASTVPEPGTAWLILIALAAFGMLWFVTEKML